MLVYYYTAFNLVAMWYYDDKMRVRMWVIDLNNQDKHEADSEAAHRTLADRRRAKHLEESGWCEVLYDSGDE